MLRPQFPITPRPEHEMPVIRHQAIGRDAYPGLGVGLGQNLLKGGVVSGFLKQRESPDTAVQDMIGEIPSSEVRATWHGASFIGPSAMLPGTDSRPFLLDPFS